MSVKNTINSIAQPFMAGNKVESIHKQGVYALITYYSNAVDGVYISSEFVLPAINGWAMEVNNVFRRKVCKTRLASLKTGFQKNR